MYTIRLADGTELKNLGKNGDNYISATEIDESIFEDNTSEIVITDENGAEEVIKNAVFIQQMQFPDGYYFCFTQKTATELAFEKIQSQIDYVAMMTDVEM